MAIQTTTLHRNKSISCYLKWVLAITFPGQELNLRLGTMALEPCWVDFDVLHSGLGHFLQHVADANLCVSQVGITNQYPLHVGPHVEMTIGQVPD